MRSARVALLASGLVTMALVLVTSAGCLNEGGLFVNGIDGGPGSGGALPTGGGFGRTGGTVMTGGQAATGGALGTGGQTSGTGGAATTGGAGNAATGGKAPGGAATAGHATGGLAMGGVATGGSATGGLSTGGAAMGGAPAGGSGGMGAGGAGMGGCGPTCDLACPQGYVLDSHGCPTCMCKPPVCPAIKCTTTCPYGVQKDANGCDTCMCLPPPPCTAAECGSKPNAPIFDCPRGGATATHCARKDDGLCAWFFDGCAGGSCGNLTCDSACWSGYARSPEGCTTCTCSGPTACDGCFGGGGPTTTCDDGTPAGYVCERSTWGGGLGGPGATCSLVSRTCPTVTSSSTCSRITTATSCNANDSCLWLDAGCKPPALGATGCYARREMGCTSDSDCGGSRVCVQRNINPCVGTDPAHCASCAVTVSLCLAP